VLSILNLVDIVTAEHVRINVINFDIDEGCCLLHKDWQFVKDEPAVMILLLLALL